MLMPETRRVALFCLSVAFAVCLWTGEKDFANQLIVMIALLINTES